MPDEDTQDMKEARARIMRIFPSEEWEDELRNAAAHAKEMLSHPTCWRLLENLATGLIDAILEGKKRAEQDGSNLVACRCDSDQKSRVSGQRVTHSGTLTRRSSPNHACTISMHVALQNSYALSVRSLLTHPGQLRRRGRVPAALHPVCGLPTRLGGS